jgi:hypothetical protein
VPILFFAEEVLEVRTRSRVFGSIIIPGLLLGSPLWVTSSMLSCMDASFRPDLWPYRYVARNMGWLIPAAISMVAHGTFLLLLSREMPLLVRRDLRKEEEPMAGPRDFPSLKAQIEKRRLAREERRREIRAPSRLWKPAVRPAVAPPGPPASDSPGTR